MGLEPNSTPTASSRGQDYPSHIRDCQPLRHRCESSSHMDTRTHTPHTNGWTSDHGQANGNQSQKLAHEVNISLTPYKETKKHKVQKKNVQKVTHSILIWDSTLIKK